MKSCEEAPVKYMRRASDLSLILSDKKQTLDVKRDNFLVYLLCRLSVTPHMLFVDRFVFQHLDQVVLIDLEGGELAHQNENHDTPNLGEKEGHFQQSPEPELHQKYEPLGNLLLFRNCKQSKIQN